MLNKSEDIKNSRRLMLGNEAIARGALEAGVQVCAGYPGTPSSEIINTLAGVAKENNIHIEWSTNEKVATEVAAAAAYAGLRSMATMKNAGVNVASDFLLHFNLSGTGSNGGGMVLIAADDPGSYSSGDELDSRWLAKNAMVPMLVPTSVQEAKEMVKEAFALSEEFGVYCVLWVYTRICHRSGVVSSEGIMKSEDKNKPSPISELISNEDPFQYQKISQALERLEKIRESFENSSFNSYSGPENPDVLLVSCGNGFMCAMEAVKLMKLEKTVGILKLGAVWPIPIKLVSKYLAKTSRVIVCEETDPFIEIHIKEIIADSETLTGNVKVFGRSTNHIPKIGELTPDVIGEGLSKLLNQKYLARDLAYSKKIQETVDPILINRDGAMCPGCPHRASFWSIKQAIRKSKKKNSIVSNDIGCYSWDMTRTGHQLTKIINCMGSGAGVASGFGQLSRFGFDQRVISVMGDSTFFHSSMPAIINAVCNGSDMMAVVMDNSATAMTGFQPSPVTGATADGTSVPVVSIEDICRAAGCQVEVIDPFDLELAIKTLTKMIKKDKGVRIAVLRRTCELIRNRKEKTKPYNVRVDENICKAEKCRFCMTKFKCPSLNVSNETGKTFIGESCSGCGVCVDICPHGAIFKEDTEA